jgi:all-trans-retinol 13,14-reductase
MSRRQDQDVCGGQAISQYDVIIVGAGLGGLTAGAKLAKEGRSVLIIEQHAAPGGFATTYKRQGFSVEVGLHVMDGLDADDPKVGIFEDLAVFDNVELIKTPEFYRVTNGETDFVMPYGRQHAISSLIERYPNEERGIRKFFDIIFRTRREVFKVPRRRWMYLLGFPLLPFICPNVVFRERQTVGHLLDSLIGSQELKLILTANLAYYHSNPYTMSLTFFSVAQASFFGGGGHFVKGGSQVLSDYLASVIEKNGGKVVLRHRVEEVIIKGGRAAGVRYRPCTAPSARTSLDTAPDERAAADAIEAFGDRIVANTAIPNLANGLIRDEPARRKIAHLIDGQEIALPLLALYLGFDKPLKTMGNDAYSTMLLPSSVTSMADLGANWHNDYSQRALVFVDYGQIDAGLDPAGKSSGSLSTFDSYEVWANLTPDEYTERKRRVTDQLIERLDQLLPGAKNQVVYADLGTPLTMQRYTLNANGTAYGFAQIPKQAGRHRVRIKSPVRDLYFASAWTEPGHGFTGAILAGYWCAEELLRKGTAR